MATATSLAGAAQATETLRQIYNLYRTALLNKLYYAAQLSKYRAANKYLEIIVAVGTSSTSIGAWAVWNTHNGRYWWAALAGVATLVSVVKPFFALPAEIERHTKLYAGFTELYYDLNKVVEKIRREKNVNQEMRTILENSGERLKTLATSDDPKPNEKLRRACTERVNLQIPVKDLWIPPATIKTA